MPVSFHGNISIDKGFALVVGDSTLYLKDGIAGGGWGGGEGDDRLFLLDKDRFAFESVFERLVFETDPEKYLELHILQVDGDRRRGLQHGLAIFEKDAVAGLFFDGG
ncbi:MAG TPA: hypothetical protein VNS58_14305 [Puia sp.]|nr:hypothetical protein [Puia sp.]